MKPLRIKIVLFLLTAPAVAFAEVPPGIHFSSSTSDTVAASTAPAVPQRAMTEPTAPGVFVTLTRSGTSMQQLPTNTTVITPKEFGLYDAQNAGEAVARQASVQTLTTGRLGSLSTTRIRGASSSQTMILIDGRPVSGIGLGAPDLSEIPVESIDRIEIVRGGVSALYGPNAVGGVINVITKRATYPGRTQSMSSYESRSFGGQAYRLNFGSRRGPVDYFFYGDRQNESGFRNNTFARAYNLGGNFGWSMGAGGKLLIDASMYHSEAGVPGLNTIPTNQFNNSVERFGSSPNAVQNTDANDWRGSYLLPLPHNMLAVCRFYTALRGVQFTDPDAGDNSDRHTQTHGVEGQLTLPLGLVVGGNFIADREDTIDRQTPANSFLKRVEDWGAFAEETLRFHPWTLIASGRYDHHSQAGDSTNPRAQLIVDATPWLRFSGSAARSFRAPTIDDLYYQSSFFVGNPALRTEKAWTYDGGFEVHQESWSVRATYFRANVTDLIQVKPDTFDTVVNIGRARRNGAEVEGRQILSPAFQQTLNYTFLENRGIPSGYSDFVLLSYSPRHTVNHLLSWTPTRKWQVDSTLRYTDPRFSGNNQTGTKLGSQLLWGLRLTFHLLQMELYAGAENLTDKRYVEQAGYPLPGRTLYGGFHLKLWD